MKSEYREFYSQSRIDKVISLSMAFIAFVSAVLPKKKGLYIYGSMWGYDIADNPKYAFLYDESAIEKYFLTKNKNLLGSVRYDKVKPVYMYSFQGVMLQLRAEKAFFSHGVFDFIPSLVWGARKINLWHGVPMREIGPDYDWAGDGKLKKKIKILFYRVFGWAYYMSCDEVWVPFRGLKENYKRFFRVSRPEISIKKQPRNECYHKNKARERSKKILFAPTYHTVDGRGFNISSFFQNIGLYDQELIDMLDASGFKLVIRPHPIDLEVFRSANIPLNVEIDFTEDLYEALGGYKGIVTDFSSVLLDGIEIGSPVARILLPNDEREKTIHVSIRKYVKVYSTIYEAICSLVSRPTEHMVDSL